MSKLSSAIFIALAFTALASHVSGKVMTCDDDPIYLTAYADSVTNTNITLEEGESVYSIATGAWRSCFGPTCVSSADGGKTYNPTSKVPTARIHALIGSLDDGNTWFEVGYSDEIFGPGTLLLSINDSNDDPSDNKGHLDILLFSTPCKQHIHCQSEPSTHPVYAKVEHMRTGAIIPAGVSVDVTAVGQWSMCKDPERCTSGPDGLPADSSAARRILDAPANSLVGSMDGMKTWFLVGSATTVTGPGELILANNDLIDLSSDNEGQVVATLTPQCRNIDWTPYAPGIHHRTCLKTVCDLPDSVYKRHDIQEYGKDNQSCTPCYYADRKICEQCYANPDQLCAFDLTNLEFYCKDRQVPSA